MTIISQRISFIIQESSKLRVTLKN